MTERPESTPEGRLIKSAMRGRSAPELARMVGISSARWRHIVNGYQPVGEGRIIRVVAPAGTLARMASAVGVTPDQLREVGRADAAEALRDVITFDTETGKLTRGAPQQEDVGADLSVEAIEDLEAIDSLPVPASKKLALLRQYLRYTKQAREEASHDGKESRRAG